MALKTIAAPDGSGAAKVDAKARRDASVFGDNRRRRVARHVADQPAQTEAEVRRSEAVGLEGMAAAAAIGQAEAAAGPGAVEAIRRARLGRAVVEVAVAEFELEVLRHVEVDA